MQRPRRSPLVASVVAVTFATGCSASAPTTGGAPTLPRVVLQVRSEHLSFILEHDGSLSVAELRDPTRDPGCGATTAFFSGALDLRIEAVPTDCAAAGPIEPGAGEHGRYRTIDDVASPLEIEEIDTALGPAVLFEQVSDGVNEPIAIVTFDDPIDPDYPTMVIRSDEGGFDRDELRSMLASLEPAGNIFGD